MYSDNLGRVVEAGEAKSPRSTSLHLRWFPFREQAYKGFHQRRPQRLLQTFFIPDHVAKHLTTRDDERRYFPFYHVYALSALVQIWLCPVVAEISTQHAPFIHPPHPPTSNASGWSSGVSSTALSTSLAGYPAPTSARVPVTRRESPRGIFSLNRVITVLFYILFFIFLPLTVGQNTLSLTRQQPIVEFSHGISL